MANRWNIPGWLEKTVTARDKTCVYCREPFSDSERKRKASWEHVINDASIITPENIALCCVACNASKGAKPLGVWLTSKYCRERNITRDNVAEVVRLALHKGDNGSPQ